MPAPKWSAALQQPELSPAAPAPDPFARARERYPHDRLILALDRRDGAKTMFRVDASSRWYDLLPPQQIVEIHPAEDAPRA